MGGKEDKVGPMFPRLHINDAEKGGPRAPPRNKMALYEQVSIPSRRSNRSIQMHPRHPSETQYSHCSDLTTTSAQAEPEDKPDEDDYMVPIFHSSPSKNPDTHFNNTSSQERISPSYSTFPHHSKSQTTGVLEHNSVTRESRINNVDLEEEKIYSSDPRKSPLSDHEVVCDLNDDSGSETSILDVVCEPALTPDDVVGVIGQKHFWKARRAIVNEKFYTFGHLRMYSDQRIIYKHFAIFNPSQQRVFAVQVFELHRLVEVQKLIAASPHLLREFDRSPENKLPSDFALKETAPNVPQKRKALFKKTTREIESPPENSIEEKASSPHSYPNKQLIGSSQSQPSIVTSVDQRNGINPYSNQPQQGHHWLVPFMSSEGLVYKPYPQQYHFPSFPQHGYFPPYGMPMMNMQSTFSGPWAQQMDPGPPRFSACESDYGRCNESNPVSEVVGVQASTASSPVEGEKMLPLFPTAPADGGPEGPSRVIKAVARNGLSASESAVRIFRSIQEERRKQYDYE